jgi:hypothetical protein
MMVVSGQIARVASASCVSTRQGPGYVIPRHFNGTVTDLDTSRCYHAIPKWLGGSPVLNFKRNIEKTLVSESDDRYPYTRGYATSLWHFCNLRADMPLTHRQVLQKVQEYNDQIGLPWQRRFGTKNTGFIEAILYHSMLYKPEIQKLTGVFASTDPLLVVIWCVPCFKVFPFVAKAGTNTVVFTDGTTFDADVIICCTGFTVTFPFLEPWDQQLAAEVCNARSGFPAISLFSCRFPAKYPPHMETLSSSCDDIALTQRFTVVDVVLR